MPKHLTTSPRLATFVAESGCPTPYLVVDLDVVAEHYRALRDALPTARVLYAVKANPAPPVLALLHRLGAGFDVASLGEIERCLRLGIDPADLSYGNTVKKERDLAAAYSLGVRVYAVDCAQELTKVRRAAPTGTVVVRLATDGASADWPLSRKFGCSVRAAGELLAVASDAGYRVGLGFHVGSQQHDPEAWRAPLAAVGELIRELRAQRVELSLLNLGGGLPSVHAAPVPSVTTYGDRIAAALSEYVEGLLPELVIESGRYLVGDAGVLVSEVVLVSTRDLDPDVRWVYLDVGLFTGLAETLGEAIRYRLRADRPGGALAGEDGPVVLAGPACDSVDILYERHRHPLPLDLAPGDRVQFLAAGAYTTGYAAAWFNGMPAPREHYLPRCAE